MNGKIYDVVEINSASTAIIKLLELRSHGFYSFRGHRNSEWRLGPHGLPDAEPEAGRDVLDILEDNRKQFVKICKQFTNFRLENKNDFWESQFFAQHHGLKTLMLDWTSNPLVALYFAVENIFAANEDSDNIYGCVWALRVKDGRWVDFSELDGLKSIKDWDYPGWIMINPPLVTPRLIVQSSKFSYHPADSDRDLRRQPLDGENGEDLVQILISPDENGYNPTKNIRKELGIMNIHHGSLFPDSDGVARFINKQWREIARTV